MKAVATLQRPAKSPAEFFKLNNTYVIPENSKLNDLLNDALALLDSGIDVFNSQPEALEAFPGGWAGLHSLQQARAVFMEVYERIYDKVGVAGQTPGSSGAEKS